MGTRNVVVCVCVPLIGAGARTRTRTNDSRMRRGCVVDASWVRWRGYGWAFRVGVTSTRAGVGEVMGMRRRAEDGPYARA